MDRILDEPWNAGTDVQASQAWVDELEALEAGTHRLAVEKILKELADAGFIEFLERQAAVRLKTLLKAWIPS